MNTVRMEECNEEWELSKENVQPIRQGRKLTNITTALQPSGVGENHQQSNVLIQQRLQWFETEIRTYSGEDPMQVWHEYIKWTEQNFPKGGRDSNLPLLLERCVSHFVKDVGKYANDARYVEAWIKFANFCSDPIEIYQFIQNKGIGWKLAIFYESLANEYENVGNTKKADNVYEEGIRRNAEPKEKLQRLHREFKCRVAREAAAGIAEEEPMDAEISQGQRRALGGLKMHGKRAPKVPVVRVGSQVQTKSRGLPGTTAVLQQSNSAPVKVYGDEDGACSNALLPATGEWTQLAPRVEVAKENTQTAGKWNKCKIPQRGGVSIGINDVDMPAFSVHEDPEQLVTPCKRAEMDRQVLSARKPQKPVNPLHNIALASVSDGNSVPMYNKHLVYAGVKEMSFEELRGAVYKQKSAQKAITEQEDRLRKQQEQFSLERERFLDEQRKLMEENKRYFEEQRQQFEELKNNVVMKSNVEIKREMSERVQEEECVQSRQVTVLAAKQSLKFANEPVSSQTNNVQINQGKPFSQRPGDVPHLRPGDVPNSRPGDVPNSRPGDVPQSRPGDVPNSRPGDVPQSRPGDVPQSRPGDVPQSRPGDVPQSRPGDVPQSRPGDVPQSRPGDVPQSRPGDVPQSRPGDVPQSRPGDVPPSRPGDVPPSRPGYIHHSRPVSYQGDIGNVIQPMELGSQSINSNASNGIIPLGTVRDRVQIQPQNRERELVHRSAMETSNSHDQQVSAMETSNSHDQQVGAMETSNLHGQRVIAMEISNSHGQQVSAIETSNSHGQQVSAMETSNSLSQRVSGYNSRAAKQRSTYNNTRISLPYLDKPADYKTENSVLSEQNKMTVKTERISLPFLDKSLEKDKDFTVTQQLCFEDMTSTGIFTNQGMVPTVTSSLKMERQQQPSQSIPANTNKTPVGLCVSNDSVPKKTTVDFVHNLSSGHPTPNTPGFSLVAPSPTVCTKEAMGVITAMFAVRDPWLPEEDQPEKNVHFEAQFATTEPSSSGFQHSSNSVFSSKTTINPLTTQPFSEVNNDIQSGGFVIYDETAMSNKENQDNRQSVIETSGELGDHLSGDQEHEMIDGMQVLQITDKMNTTLANTGPQSDNFQRAARMASTPFNPSALFNPSACPPSPPCSTIRGLDNTHNHRQLNLGDSLLLSTVSYKDDAHTGQENVKMKLGEILTIETENHSQNTAAVRITKQSSEENYETTINTVPPSTPLSPILERSSEDYHSSKSSAGSSGMLSQLSSRSMPLCETTKLKESSICNLDNTSQKLQETTMKHTSQALEHTRETNISHSMSVMAHPQETNISRSMSVMEHPQEIISRSMSVMERPQVTKKLQETTMKHTSQALEHTQETNISRSMSAIELPQETNISRSMRSMELPQETNICHSMSDVERPQKTNISHSISAMENMEDEEYCNTPTLELTSGINPFDKNFISHLLTTISTPLQSYPGYFEIDSDLPNLQQGLAINFDSDLFQIKKRIGEGAFAKIYRAGKLDANDFSNFECHDEIVLKVQKPAWPWEFYIVRELGNRLQMLKEPIDISCGLIELDTAYMYNNGSILTTKLQSNGSLLSLINLYSKMNNTSCMPEPLIIFYTIEILHIVEQMHKCGIIHADIKPDNFLVRNIDEDIDTNKALSEVAGLQLIDFGQSIDMKLVPEGTTFTSSCYTSGFMCHEMQTGKPWTYQTDYYGIAATVYCMMFGQYMSTFRRGIYWRQNKSVYRWFHASVWNDFFHDMLNVPGCTQLPSLSDHRQKLQEILQTVPVETFQKLKQKQDMMLFEAQNM